MLDTLNITQTNQTHEVFNQAPALEDYNLYSGNPVLKEAVHREGADWADDRLIIFGKECGSKKVLEWARLANENIPVLHTHDRFGNRIDEVEFHPAWHHLMSLSVSHDLHALPWKEHRKGAHVARAALTMMLSETELGHLCPVSMTFSIVPALKVQADVAKEWMPLILSNQYDSRFIPAYQKKGIICGMAMTEKQGGSDVRANTTKAMPIGNGGPGKEYLITGHKWFCSAPMSDAFLILAQAPGGLSCFLLPRWTPDGKRNHFFIQRLKDKLGNRSNASSEIEMNNAWARLIGEEGKGVATIIEMVNHTRLDCVIASTGIMHQATHQAIHHCRHRSAFGKTLINQPLMQNVLADLSLETEAAILLMMRLARAFDEKSTNEEAALFSRIVTPISKFWICKRTPNHVYEALECHGGNGFAEESIMPRLYREAPLYSIWEGSGNVICLDVLRVMKKEPIAVSVLLSELNKVKGANQKLDKLIEEIEDNIISQNINEFFARFIVERIALALQAALMIQYSLPETAEIFCESRIGEYSTKTYGTLTKIKDQIKIIDRIFI
jgi:putative acyl-CoA dehydrogenase